jgi:hypothetical protein
MKLLYDLLVTSLREPVLYAKQLWDMSNWFLRLLLLSAMGGSVKEGWGLGPYAYLAVGSRENCS